MALDPYSTLEIGQISAYDTEFIYVCFGPLNEIYGLFKTIVLRCIGGVAIIFRLIGFPIFNSDFFL